MADEGVPGGYGAVGRRGGGGRVIEPVVAPTYGTSGGYYTDASGRQISQAEAQALGRVDAPGAAAEKLRSIGGGASTTQIEQRMGIEEARKRGDITRAEAITLTQQNLEGRPLQLIRQATQQEQQRRADVAALQEFRERTGRLSPVGRGYREAIARKETIRQTPERVYVKIGGRNVPFVSSDKYKGLTSAETIQKAGGLRTTAAILSSTELFTKAAETEARGIGKLLGFDSKYDKALGELVAATSERLKAKPGALNVLLESPLTAAIPVGAGLKVGTFAARAALVSSASKISKLSPTAARILKTGSLAVEPIVSAGVVGYVGKDLLSSKDYYEAIGKVATYGVMTPGAAFGYKQATKGISAFQTRGLETVPAPISPEVLTGKITFPTTRAGKFKTFKEEFRDIEGKFSGYHATSEAFGKKGFEVRGLPEAELRPLDVPGLYISPYKAGASPVFLRVPGEGRIRQTPKQIIRELLSSSSLKPEVNLIRNVKDIQRISKGGTKNVAEARNILRGTVGRTGGRSAGVGFIEPKIEIGGFRGEAQAVLAPGTQISGITAAKRFKYKGQYIPLVERTIEPVTGKIKEDIPSLPFSAKKSNNILRTRQYYESGGVRPMSPIRYSTTKPPSRPSSSLASLPSSILKQYSRPGESISRATSSITIASSILRPPTSRKPPTSTRKLPPSRPPTSTTRRTPSRPPTSTTRRPPSRPPSSPPYKPPTRKKPPRTPKNFDEQLGDLEKARKKRGKFVWNIKNQIPTLESLIG